MSIARENSPEQRNEQTTKSDQDLSKQEFPPELRQLWQRVAEEATRYGGGSEQAQSDKKAA